MEEEDEFAAAGLRDSPRCRVPLGLAGAFESSSRDVSTMTSSQLPTRGPRAVYQWHVGESSSPLPRLGEFLVRLERLERSQPADVFLVDRLTAAPSGVMLTLPSGAEVLMPVDASTDAIGEALRRSIPDLQMPDADEDPDISADPNAQVQWAQLH